MALDFGVLYNDDVVQGSPSVTATSEYATLPASNLEIPRRHCKWLASGTGTQSAIVDLGSAKNIWGMAILGHNLKSSGASSLIIRYGNSSPPGSTFASLTADEIRDDDWMFVASPAWAQFTNRYLQFEAVGTARSFVIGRVLIALARIDYSNLLIGDGAQATAGARFRRVETYAGIEDSGRHGRRKTRSMSGLLEGLSNSQRTTWQAMADYLDIAEEPLVISDLSGRQLGSGTHHAISCEAVEAVADGVSMAYLCQIASQFDMPVAFKEYEQ